MDKKEFEERYGTAIDNALITDYSRTHNSNARTLAEQTGQAPPDSGGGGGVVGNITSALGWVGDQLEKPYDNTVAPVLGAVAKLEAHTGTGTYDNEDLRHQIMNADSFKEAHDLRLGDMPGYQQFAVKAATDPLNLVGVGHVNRVRQAARARNMIQAGDKVDTVLGTARTLDERAGQLFAAPITGGTWLVKNTLGRTKVGGWFAESARGQYFSGLRKVKQTFGRLGEDEALRGQAGSILRNEDDQIARQLYRTDETTNMMSYSGNDNVLNTLTDYQVVRQYTNNKALWDQTPELKNFMRMRGMMDGNTVSTPFLVHAEIDASLRGAGINAVERDIVHLLVDMMADGIPKRQDWDQSVYQTPEDVLNNIQFYNTSGATEFVRDGATLRVGIGQDATAEQVAAGLFEGFLGPAMNRTDRARLLQNATPDRPRNAPYTAEDWNGIGQRVVQMMRQTDVTTDAALQGLFNQFRSMTRLSPQGEGLPNAAAETIMDTLSPEEMGTRRNVFSQGPDTRPGAPPPEPPMEQSRMDLPATQERLPMDAQPPPAPRAPRQMSLEEQARNVPTGEQLPLDLPPTVEQAQLPLGQASDTNIPPPQGPQINTQPGDYIPGPPAPQRRRLTSEDANAETTPQGFQRRFGPEAPGGPQTPLSQLAPDATFDEYITRLADTHGMQPQQFESVRQSLTPAIERNADYFRSGALVGNESFENNLLEAIRNPERQEFFLSEAMDAIDLPNAASMFRNPILYKYTRLPEVTNMKKTKGASVFGKITDTQLKEDREYAAKVLQSEVVQKELKEWEEKARLVDAALDTIKQTVPIAPVLDSTSFRQALTDKRIAKHFTPEQRKALGEAVDMLGGTRGATQRDLNYSSRVFDAWDKALKKDLGIKPPRHGPVVREMENVTKAWREQALMSVRYFTANALDMAVKSAVYGVEALNPIGLRDAAQQQAVRWGLTETPDSLKTAGLQEISARTGQIEPGRLTRESQLGKYAGLFSDTAQRGVDRAVNVNRNLAIGLEDTARTAAWIHGVRRYLEDSFHGRFLNWTAQRARESGMSAEATQALVRELRTQGVHYGPDDVRQWVVNNGGNQELATDIATMWQRGIQEGSQHGEELAMKIHFQIGDERVIEDKLKLRHILPFHTWATRNIPFYLQTMAANPWIYRTMNHYNNANEAEMEEMGLTARFKSKMLLPEQVNGVWSLLMGPGHHAYNPMMAFSIADQFKGGYQPDSSESSIPMLGSALNLAGQAGFKPAPWFDLPLNIAGVYGTQEPFGLWRHGDFVASGIEHTTGINVDFKPTARATTALRNTVGIAPQTDTVSNSQNMDREINRTLRDMSIEATGSPDSPEYVAASLNPDDPLYKEARSKVVSRNLRRSTQGLISPFPYTSALDNEMDAWANNPQLGDVDLPPEMRQYMRDINHPATAFWSVPDNAVSTQVNAGYRLSEGIPYSQQFEALSEYDLEFFWEYRNWREQQPQGADTSVAAFMDNRQRRR